MGQDSEAALRGAVEVLITEVFGDTERNLAKVSGVMQAIGSHAASWVARSVQVSKDEVKHMPGTPFPTFQLLFLICAVWCQPCQQRHHSHSGFSAWQQAVGGFSW